MLRIRRHRVAPLVSGLDAEMFGTRYKTPLLWIAFVMHQVGSSLGAWCSGLPALDGEWMTFTAKLGLSRVLSL
jgi:hypothetical protein